MRKKSLEEQLREQESIEQTLGERRHPIVGVLDNLRSAYNVGAIFRTADGIRAERLILCGFTPTPPRQDIRKTALGAEESVPWQHTGEVTEAVRELREAGYQIVVLERTDECHELRQVRFRFPVALVVGNEWHGVTDAVLSQADLAVFIPMYGRKTSLNVAVAFAVAAYEILRQWQVDARAGHS